MKTAIAVKDYFKYNTDAGTFDHAVIFQGVINDLKRWTGIDDLTVQDIAAYFWDKYASMLIWDYPDEYAYSQVQLWHSTRLYYFEGLYDTTQLDYNPIYNVDEYSSENSTRTPNLQHTKTGTDTTAFGHVVGEQNSVTGTNQVTTYDSSSFNDDSKSTQTGTSTVNNSGSDTVTHNTTDSDTGTETNALTKRRYGNIGVTSSQQLIDAERNIRNFSIFDVWCERFAERFFIPIYINKECF